MAGDLEPITLTAGQVGELLGYSPDTVRRLVREGRLPLPIDPDLSAKLWRWSRRGIEQYVAGDIKPRAVAS